MAGIFFKSVLSTESEAEAAIDEIGHALDGINPDLLVVFASHHYGPHFDQWLDHLHQLTNPRNLVGCTAEGIIGPNREVEHAPAISVLAARLPNVRILPFVLDQSDATSFGTDEDWIDRTGVSPADKPSFVVLPDPFSVDAEYCLNQMNQVYTGSVIVGGMASGAEGLGQNRLFLNDQVLRQGLVGVSLSGPVAISTVVSQGCRPIGELFLVTKAEDNIIQELRGKPAMDILRAVFESAPLKDREIIQRQGVHIGCLMGTTAQPSKKREVLIRSLLGVVENKGLAVNSLIKPGQVIQFHVRDAHAASEDLRMLLTGKMAEIGRQPRGGLLFSCNGRGRRMFGVPHHDINMVNRLLPECQVVGFFAGGEIGPIGDKTYIHGFTGSLVLFHDTP